MNSLQKLVKMPHGNSFFSILNDDKWVFNRFENKSLQIKLIHEQFTELNQNATWWLIFFYSVLNDDKWIFSSFEMNHYRLNWFIIHRIESKYHMVTRFECMKKCFELIHYNVKWFTNSSQKMNQIHQLCLFNNKQGIVFHINFTKERKRTFSILFLNILLKHLLSFFIVILMHQSDWMNHWI